MRYTGDHAYPFDDTDRAYRRFLDIAREHFDVIGWTTGSGRPALTTLRDLASGDMFTVAIVDSDEAPLDPHILLAIARDKTVIAHGVFDGPDAADAYAPHLALDHGAITATKPTALRPSDETKPSAEAWHPIPAALAARLHVESATDGETVLILLDRSTHCLAAVGPFPGPGAAQAWHHDDPLGAAVDRMLVPLHPSVSTRIHRSAS